MKSASGIIITFCILISFLGCKKTDILEDDPIPSLAYIDISGAKFFLCNKLSENSEYDFSKISAEGIETGVTLMDENHEPVDLKSMNIPNLIFSLDEYIGLDISWNKTKTIGNMSYSNTTIFYLIHKTDGKVLVSYDVTESNKIQYGLNFSIDPNDVIYYKGNDQSLNKFTWNKSDPSDVKREVIDTDVEKYILAPNGDLAYMKKVDNNPKYYFKFSNGSTMEIPSPWSNPNKTYYESSGIIKLGITNYGKFCAYYKNADSDICQIKVLTELAGRTDFWFCNSVGETIDEFYCLGDQLWGIHYQANNYVNFINFSECGSYTEYPDYFLCQELSKLRHSHNFFYFFVSETKKVYRLSPGNGIPSVWLTFPNELDVYGSDFDFSEDEYSIFQAYFLSQDPQNYWRYFFLDNNGDIIAEKEGKNVFGCLVL